MNAKELHTLELFSLLGCQQQKAFVRCFDCDFLRFVSECIANILLGNVPIYPQLIYKFEAELTQLRKKSLSTTARRELLSSKKGIELLNTISNCVIKRLK